jgi:hypothetical protein
MAADAFAKTAYYKMMADTGLMALRKSARALTQDQVSAEAQRLAANADMWNSIYETMQWVSGEKALEKIAEYIGKIKERIQGIKATLADAKANLTPENYAAVAAEAKGIDGSIAVAEKWVPGATSEIGTTGMGVATAALVAVAGVVIGILAVIYKYMDNAGIRVGNKAAEMAEKQRRDEVDAANAKQAQAAAAIDAQVAAGNIDAARGEALKLQASGEAEAAIKAAGTKAADATKKAEELAQSTSGGGFFGLNTKWLAIGGIALVGLIALPQIIAVLPKRK